MNAGVVVSKCPATKFLMQHNNSDLREPFRSDYCLNVGSVYEPMDANEEMPAGSCVLLSMPAIGMAWPTQTKVSR